MIKKKNIFLITFIVIVFLINVSLIFNPNVWCDEAASINLTKLPIPDLISAVARDVHPPLYYFILKLFGHFFGYQLAGYKFVSILPCMLALCLGDYWLIKHLPQRNYLSAYIFTLLVGLAPCASGKNVEVRMYTWAALWCLLCALMCWNIAHQYRQNISWIILIFSSLAAMYTHYFALLTICILLLGLYILLIRQKKTYIYKTLLFYLPIVLGYLPWIPNMLRQMRDSVNVWTINIDLTPAYVFELLRYPFEGDYSASFSNEYTVLCWAMILVLIYLGISCIKKKNSQDSKEIICFAHLAILTFFLVVIGGLVISILFHPILFRRYLFPSIYLLWLGVAILASQVSLNRKECSFLIAVLSIMSIDAYGNSYYREYHTGTQDTLDQLYGQIKEDDLLINDYEVCMCWELKYYFPANAEYYLTDGVVYSNDGVTPWYNDTSIDIYTTQQDIWYFSRSYNQLDTNRLQENGYLIDNVYYGNFDNYYSFTVYHIYKERN